MLPTQYIPLTPDDFIGDAANVARQLKNVVKQACEAGNAPIKILFNGEPGIGKSALAKYLERLLGCDPKWSTKKYNGTQVDKERVEDLANDLHYRDMFGTYRLILIEEADAIPAVAQIRFLTLLDDLPASCAVVCTSNCTLDEFKKRFQTRFKVYELEPPKQLQIAELLGRFITDKQAITNISTFACGNVRAALLDAEMSLQAA